MQEEERENWGPAYPGRMKDKKNSQRSSSHIKVQGADRLMLSYLCCFPVSLIFLKNDKFYST
jgi:hypothetical protein